MHPENSTSMKNAQSIPPFHIVQMVVRDRRDWYHLSPQLNSS